MSDRSTIKSWANTSPERPTTDPTAHEVDGDPERDHLPALSYSVSTIDSSASKFSRNDQNTDETEADVRRHTGSDSANTGSQTSKDTLEQGLAIIVDVLKMTAKTNQDAAVKLQSLFRRDRD